MKFSDQIRAAIEASDVNRRQIALASDVDESALSKFCRGQRGLSLDAIDRIAELLGLEVRVASKRSTTIKKGN